MAEQGGKRPRYMEVADALRREIDEGRLTPGQALPSELVLAKKFKFARNTIRQAIDQLRAEGLVVSVFGRGSTIRGESAVRQITMERYRAEFLQVSQGLPAPEGQYQLTQRCKKVPAPSEIAGWMKILPDTEVLWRQQVHSVISIPQVLTTSYFPLDLVEGTPIADENRITDGGSVADLYAIGVRVTEVVEAKRARMPTRDEAKELKIVGVAAVMAVRRIMYAGSRIVEVAHDIVYPGDRIELVDRIEF